MSFPIGNSRSCLLDYTMPGIHRVRTIPWWPIKSKTLPIKVGIGINTNSKRVSNSPDRSMLWTLGAGFSLFVATETQFALHRRTMACS